MPEVQYSTFVMQYLVSIQMDCDISELCYIYNHCKGTILQRNYGQFYKLIAYNSFVKFHIKFFSTPQHDHAIPKIV